MGIYRKIIALGLVTVLLAGCASVPSVSSGSKGLVKANVVFAEAKEAEPLEVLEALRDKRVKQANLLGFELLAQLAAANQDDNMLFSPTSLAFALAMLQNGAAGKTKTDILGVMGEDTRALNEDYQAWMRYLNLLAHSAAKDLPELKLQLANSLWLKEGLSPKQNFVDTLSAYYDAEVYQVDFSKDNAVKEMNSWVEAKTNGLLKDTFKELDPKLVAILMNTVYFKGAWISEFDIKNTKNEPYYLTPSDKVDVAMMHQTNSFAYFENEQLQLAGLPYYGGATMWVVLPKSGLPNFTGEFNYDGLVAWIASARTNNKRLELSLPKLDYSVSNPLSDILKKAGMDVAFSPSDADFSELIAVPGENVYVSQIFQNAKILVDEVGTEAAAVTVVEMGVTSMPVEEKPIIFNANKPFTYFIMDDQTSSLLFAGVVRNPSKK